jgi:hypothetical protein
MAMNRQAVRMTGARSALTALSIGAWLTWLCAACSGSSKPQVGGETHWLSACAQDEDCSEFGLICVCGSCTRACSDDASCTGSRAAACFDVASPLLAQRCEARSQDSSGGLCLPTCTTDSQCSAAHSCSAGACLPALAAAGSDAGSAALEPPISSFDAVDASTVWTLPVALAPAPLSIAGADPQLVGTWREAGCDPLTRTCRQLVIAKTAAGDVVGHLNFVGSQNRVGPFSAATRADVGYPTELTPAHYDDLIDSPTAIDVDYRMLGGRFEGGYLSFTWTPYDVWHAWCQLQTPYLWQLDGHGFYFCSPQAAEARARMDDGKLVLCSSADFEASCTAGGDSVPCACGNASCAIPHCNCDSGACDATQLLSSAMHLRLDGDQLIGSSYVDPASNAIDPVTFERVIP